MSKNEDVKAKILNESEDRFRSYAIETQAIAYVVRKAPKHAVSIMPEWFRTEIYARVIRVLKEKRAIVSPELLLLEIRDTGISGDESEVLEDTIDDIFDEDIEGFDDHTFRALLDQLVKMYDSRRIFTVVAHLSTHMDTFDLEKDREKILQASMPTSVTDHRSGGFYADDYLERKTLIEERAAKRAKNNNEHTGVPTGISQFDNAIGGVMSGEFAVIAGQTGIGKTAALVHHAITSSIHGYNTFFVSGEMNKHALQFRIDSNLTAIPSTLFRLSELEDGHYQRWDDVIKDFSLNDSNGFLYVKSYPRGFTAEDLQKDIYWLQDETGERVNTICMDYLNIMRAKQARGKTQEWASQAESAWDFKELCIDFDMSGFTANQIIDEAYNKPLLKSSDLKYARAISEAAPIIIGLTQCDEDRLLNRMVYQPIKVREAQPPKPIYLNPRMDIMRIHTQMMHSVNSLSDIGPQLVDIDAIQSKKSKRERVREV